MSITLEDSLDTIMLYLWEFKADIATSLDKFEMISYITIVLLTIAVLIGAINIWNQRKIKKMLREMQEQKDKPQ